MASESSSYVLDTSVIIAILTRESGWERWEERLTTAVWLGVGVPTLLETYIVMARKFVVDPRPRIDTMIHSRQIGIIPFTAEHLRVAQDAFLRFGKGRHPAALNYGDCMAYATARVAGRPLLYAGDDFARTDAAPA